MKKQLSILCLLLNALALMAEPPADYYSSIDGKKGKDIQTALSNKISNHTNVGYDGLYDVYETSDVRADGTIWDTYSDCAFSTSKTCGSYKDVCNCYNREHTIPQSWGADGAAKSDAFHVLPTDGYVNNQRSNYPYGECEGGTRLSNKARGKLGSSTFPGYSGKVFEVDDEYKGDIARGYFYMLCAYMNKSFEGSGGNVIFDGPGALTSYGLNLLLKWHRLDPVSQKERDRNDAIYAKQHNRNPFIDYPCLVEYIWGDNKNEVLNLANIMSAYAPEYEASDLTGCYNAPTSPTILTPKSGSVVEVGSASLNKTVSANVFVEAALLNAPIQLTISGANAAYFSVSTPTIPAATANTGTNIAVSYTPAALGNHTATLTLSSNGSNTVAVTLKGQCVASLVSPAENIFITNNNVGTTEIYKLLVRGTNLSSGVSLQINDNAFTLSRDQLTADEVNNGVEVDLNFTPKTIGTYKAELSVVSADFATRTIAVQGSCLFEILPVSDITYKSVRLNWTNAGTTNYTINVYQKSTIGVEEVLVMSDDCAATNGAKSGYTNVESQGGLRLGSGSQIGTLTFSNIDLSEGGRIEFEAKYYNQDACPVVIQLGSSKFTQELTNAFDTYSISIEANEAYKNVNLVFSNPEKGKRVIIKTIKVYTGGEKEENVSLEGYPVQVGNVQTYVVENLDSITEYYFTVQPEGQAVSEENMFLTDNSGTSALSSFIYEGITYMSTADGIELSRIPQGSSLLVFDAQGRLVYSVASTGSVETIRLSQGFYLIKVGNEVFKIVK